MASSFTRALDGERGYDAPGRGAGLPAVYEAVVAYGGTMKITSTAGVGTGFDISIPTKKGKK